MMSASRPVFGKSEWQPFDNPRCRFCFHDEGSHRSVGCVKPFCTCERFFRTDDDLWRSMGIAR